MPSLYQASSTFSTFEYDNAVLRDVAVQWFHAGRRRASRPYQKLISDYSRLDDTEQAHAAQWIDELLTEDEVTALRKALRRLKQHPAATLSESGGDLKTVETHFPISGPRSGYTTLPVGGSAMRFALIDLLPDLDLEIPLMGYLHLSRPSVPDRLEDSAAYLHRALQMLDLDQHTSYDAIREVASKIYSRSGHYAIQDLQHTLLDKVDLG
ncbi:MAG: hypothetical protein RhofKO_30690 [Rhodothermales bacterium]